MGDERPATYGRSVWRARLEETQRHAPDFVPLSVLELGPGRSLAGPISALLDGANRAIALDVVDYTTRAGNLRVYEQLAAESGAGREWRDSIRRTVEAAKSGGTDKRLSFALLAFDRGAIEESTIDFAYSISVLEHVADPSAVYRNMFAWVRPGGYMTHKIDFSSHGITSAWNGHYWLPAFLWILIRGRRKYLLNRWPPSQHRDAITAAGFEIIDCIDEVVTSGAVDPAYAGVPSQFTGTNHDDFLIKTSTIIAKKPDYHLSANE